jgi:N-acetylglutamate synthase
MDYHIREMTLNDYEKMFDLWKNTQGMGISSSDSKENIDVFLKRNPELSFIAELENNIIGTIMCSHDGRRGFIYHLAVSTNFRLKGIGKSLISKSLEKLKKLGIIKCHLFVKKNNLPGLDFWEKNGWTKRDDIVSFSKELQ